MKITVFESTIIAMLILAGSFFIAGFRSDKNVAKTPTMNFPAGYTPPSAPSAQSEENSVIKDGIQYVTITARGGYSPRVSNAKAGIPTKLVIKTNGTYDCSAALIIRSLSFQKMLPNTGETIIDAGTPKAGDVIKGVCGMGMYNFSVNFQS